MSLDKIVNRQNADGGWPYVCGKSWTEPTADAVLALLAAGENQAVAGGLRWLQYTQRPDGGWPPQAGLDDSTWVTALAALVPPDRLGAATHARAIHWLLNVTGEESTVTYRLRQWLDRNPKRAGQEYAGWPWVPGAAAWVLPTAAALLALEKEGRRDTSSQIHERIETGRRFLLSRTCTEGGWDHGGVPDTYRRARPYPEVTGMALAALRGVQSLQVARALELAKGFLGDCRSGDALNWLRLGLLAHGQLPPGYRPPPEVAYRTLPDLSLEVLVSADPKGCDLVWGC